MLELVLDKLQLPVPAKFVLAFAIVIALILASAWAIRRLSEMARGSEQASAPMTEAPVGPRWNLIALSVFSSHLFVYVFASKPDVPRWLSFALMMLVVVGLMMTLRREFAKR